MAMTPSSLEHYTWTFPGAPVRVCIQLEVIRHLQELLTPPTGNPGAVSIGYAGVLLGKLGGANGTEISAVIASIGEGPDAIPATLKSLRPSRDLVPVGFYRAVPGPDLRLNDDDFHLAGRLFSDPGNVFLIVRVSETGADKATFFFWDQNKMHRDFPILEFPFDASRLAAREGQRAARARTNQTEAPAIPIATPQPAQSLPQKQAVRLPKLALLACLLGVIAVFAGIRYLRLPASVPKVGAPAPLTETGTSLGLRFEHQGADLVVAWDRDAGVRCGATAGLLSIKDGASERAIGLSVDLVNAGRVFLSPRTSQVQVQLTLLVPNQRTVTESGMAILSSRGSEAMTVRSVAVPAPAKTGFADRVAPAVPKSSPARSFAPPSGRAPEPRAFVDEPPVVKGAALNVTPAPALSPLVANAPAPPAPTGNPPVAQPAPPVVSPAPSPQVPPAYTVQPAEYIGGPRPAYPPAARDAHIEGVVVVEALVGADGNVKQAKAISGHRLLMTAASRAVLLWSFRPATINGKPVEAPVRVEVKFHGWR